MNNKCYVGCVSVGQTEAHELWIVIPGESVQTAKWPSWCFHFLPLLFDLSSLNSAFLPCANRQLALRSTAPALLAQSLTLSLSPLGKTARLDWRSGRRVSVSSRSSKSDVTKPEQEQPASRKPRAARWRERDRRDNALALGEMSAFLSSFSFRLIDPHTPSPE